MKRLCLLQGVEYPLHVTKACKIVTELLNLDGASPKAYHSRIRTMGEFGMAKKFCQLCWRSFCSSPHAGAGFPPPRHPGTPEPLSHCGPHTGVHPYDGPVSP